MEISHESRVRLGENYRIASDVELSFGYEHDQQPTIIGDDATIRSGSTIYAGVKIGDRFTTGHNVLIREETSIDNDVLIGTNTVVDGRVDIGSSVSIQTGVYIPPETSIGDKTFIGPGTVLTNDPYPIRTSNKLNGPTLEGHVSIGANATILPGITIGTGSFIAAGSVVTKDIPPETLGIGVPAELEPLPSTLQESNQI